VTSMSLVARRAMVHAMTATEVVPRAPRADMIRCWLGGLSGWWEPQPPGAMGGVPLCFPSGFAPITGCLLDPFVATLASPPPIHLWIFQGSHLVN